MKKVIIYSMLMALSGYSFTQEIPKDSVKVYLQKAQSFFRQGKKTEANAIYDVLMKSYPVNQDAVQGWLIANMKRSPTGEMDAILQLDSLNRIYPKNTGIIFYRAFVKAEYGKNEEALKDIEMLIAIQPDSANNWIMKGQVLYQLNKHTEAAEAFERATTLNPARPDVWGMKAAALLKTGNYKEALISANKGVEMSPRDPNAIYNRGCIYSLTGDKVNALADLRKAVEINPRLKQHARAEEDFKSLWEDEDFIKLTGDSAGEAGKNKITSSVSNCTVSGKNYKRKDYLPKISGNWKAVEVWVHEANLLGERNFFFSFLTSDSIKITEPETNWKSEGTWSLDTEVNTIQWKMPNADQSFSGKYDFIDGYMILSGNGFIGAQESVCLKLKKQ